MIPFKEGFLSTDALLEFCSCCSAISDYSVFIDATLSTESDLLEIDVGLGVLSPVTEFSISRSASIKPLLFSGVEAFLFA
jgi:hypothetical protein